MSSIDIARLAAVQPEVQSEVKPQAKTVRSRARGILASAPYGTGASKVVLERPAEVPTAMDVILDDSASPTPNAVAIEFGFGRGIDSDGNVYLGAESSAPMRRAAGEASVRRAKFAVGTRRRQYNARSRKRRKRGRR